MDIGGDIAQIWMDSDIIGGADIANLTGARLYEQIHSQCIEFVREFCPRTATMNMVTAAYGMSIEQDCNAIRDAMEQKNMTAQALVRQTGRDMATARLDTYNAHNSTEINECIAQVRRDITGPGGCGSNFVRCLDVTGLFLNLNDGSPIMSPNFHRLETQISLSGDALLNNHNRPFVTHLERLRSFADRGLSTCREVSEGVWTEFKRQALVEIYQGQQERVQIVKESCIDTLNKCYENNLESLRDFSNVADHVLLGQRIELSESLCSEQLVMCTNLFGGQNELANHLHNIGSTKIADGCKKSLSDFVKTLCTPPTGLDFGFPWACRMHAPGALERMEDGIIGSDLDNPTTIIGRLARHANDYCVRSDEKDNPLPQKVLMDITEVLAELTHSMQLQLKTVCEDSNLSQFGSGVWMQPKPRMTSLAGVLITHIYDSSNPPNIIGHRSTWKEEYGIQSCDDVIAESVSLVVQAAVQANRDAYNGSQSICKNFSDKTSAHFNWGYCTINK